MLFILFGLRVVYSERFTVQICRGISWFKTNIYYHIEPDKKSTSTEPGTSNAVIVSWKKKRTEELTQEIRELETLMGEEE